MPKNKVQFQKGLSLPQFLADFSTEQQCEQALFDPRGPNGLALARGRPSRAVAGDSIIVFWLASLTSLDAN